MTGLPWTNKKKEYNAVLQKPENPSDGSLMARTFDQSLTSVSTNLIRRLTVSVVRFSLIRPDATHVVTNSTNVAAFDINENYANAFGAIYRDLDL